MALGGPNVYPGVLSWLGIAREATVGTPVLPTYTHPLEQGSFEPEDTPKFLDDKAIRGSMTDLFYKTLGVESATFSFGGPNFLDTHGYFLDNLCGDLSTTGVLSGATATVATSPVSVGATVASVGAPGSGFTVGAYVQIGTALTSNTPACYINEVVQISATAASSISFGNNPGRFAHTVGTVIQLVAGPYTHRFASLNSPLGYGGAYGAQPPTHTFTDVTNIVNTLTNPTYGTAAANPYGARAYPSAVLKQMDFTGNAEQLLMIKESGDSWISAPVPSGTAPTLLTTGARPIPAWKSQLNLAGSQFFEIGEFMFSFKRATQVYWTVQGIQNPYIIARGPLNVEGSLNFDPAIDEYALDFMLLNSQPPLSVTVSNSGIPNSGPPFSLTFTCSQAAFTKTKIARSKQLIGYSSTFDAVANATDVGGSAGLGPGTITLTNNIPTY